MKIDDLTNSFESDYIFYDMHNNRIQVNDLIIVSGLGNNGLDFGIVTRFGTSVFFYYRIIDNKISQYEYRCSHPRTHSLVVNKLYDDNTKNIIISNGKSLLEKQEAERIARIQHYILFAVRYKDKFGFYCFGSLGGEKLSKDVFYEKMSKVQSEYKECSFYPYLKKGKIFSSVIWDKAIFSNIKITRSINTIGLCSTIFLNKFIEIEVKDRDAIIPSTYDNLIFRYSDLNPKLNNININRNIFDKQDPSIINTPTTANLEWNKNHHYYSNEYKGFPLLDNSYWYNRNGLLKIEKIYDLFQDFV